MTSLEPLIRSATVNDVGALGRLGALLVEEHYDFDRRRFLEPRPGTREMYGSFLATQLNDARAVLLVAEHEGGVIGYAYGAIEGFDYLALRGPAAVLHDLLVDPNHRGRGIGRALLMAMLEAFHAHRVPRVVLSAAEKNTAAQNFFERTGFRRTMVEMTKDLERPT